MTHLTECLAHFDRLIARSTEIRGYCPASNIVSEAHALVSAAATQKPFDLQRVYELVGASTGTSGMMVFKDADAKLFGEAIDYVLRAVARPDQAAVCAERVLKLAEAYDAMMFIGGNPAAGWTTFAQSIRGAELSLAFGPSSYDGPEWESLWEDDLRDGKDPKTTRTGNVEGW